MSDKIYDFAIIGSGLGGLQCAYILADHGYSVCVLEKNRQLGGCLQVFSRDKTIFDTGLHYVPGLDPGQNLNRYFKYFNLLDTIGWKKLDPLGFDRISFDGESTDHPLAQSWADFEANLVQQFPSEKMAIEEYASTVRSIAATFPLDSLTYSPKDNTDSSVLGIGAKQYIESLTDNTRLQAVLAGNNLLYAGTASKCPLYVHALITNGYVMSAYRCVNGGSQIAKELASAIRKKGGAVLRRKKVVSFSFDSDRISAVHTEDGDAFRARNFISDIEPKMLMRLLGKDQVQRSYYNRMQRLLNTLSSFCVHIACRPDSFPYLNYNIYHHRSEDVWTRPDYREDEWPLSYMLCTPATSGRLQFAKSISIITYMRFGEVRQWEHTHNTVENAEDRGASYQEFKTAKTEQLLDAVEKRFPAIRNCIQSIHASSPLTYRDYIGNDDGTMYGTEKDFHTPLTNFISAKTKIPNLWLTGQYLNLHGILGVTISSVITCSEFIDRKKLLDRINQSRP